MRSNSALWQRIRSFDLDGSDADFPFSARLARENQWSPEETADAVAEYKKFIYLICVASAPLTPSAVVDQVWHLHLVYTRSYWTDFCAGVLGRPVHHEPTKGGRDQADLFEDQYERTRSLYCAEFGSEPPASCWPLVPLAEAADHRWVNRRAYWIVPKRVGRWIAQGCLLVGFVALVQICAPLASDQRPGASHLGALGKTAAIVILGAFAMILGVKTMQWTFKHSSSDAGTVGCGGCGGGCGGCGG